MSHAFCSACLPDGKGLKFCQSTGLHFLFLAVMYRESVEKEIK
jgi:hypothetical protein